MMNGNKWTAYGYARISKDDKEQLESNSITNQKSLIERFISERNDIELLEILDDDGFRGGNMKRPAFRQLIEAIDKGVINCVVVKDSSRFGRDLIETGKFIEKYFVAKNVRFISVTESYDSMDTSDNEKLMFSFRNILNDAYLEDISNKTKSALKSKRENGIYVSPFAPYGYLKAEDKSLMVDEFAAMIVKRIFAEKIEGYNQQGIANRLNADGVLSPLDYKKSIGSKFKTTFKTGDKSLWSAKAIGRILKNKIYIGHLEQGKKKSIDYKEYNMAEVATNNWSISYNKHEATINESDFYTVQQLLERDTRTANASKKLKLFSGFLFCAHCGEQMIVKTMKKRDKLYVYYVCGTHKKQNSCVTKCINEDIINKFVFHSLKNQIAAILHFEYMINSSDLKTMGSRKLKRIDELVANSFSEIEKFNHYLVKSYEEKLNETISQDEYLMFKGKFNADILRTENIIENLQRERNAVESGMNLDSVLERFKANSVITELSRTIIAYFIDKIVVYDERNIEIIYKYQDELDYIFETAKTSRMAVI